MLKIKDNVDLKELEKYGFELNKYHWCKDGVYERPLLFGYETIDRRSVYIDITTRIVEKETMQFSVVDVSEADVDDLIKDGLVEKVEE